MTDTLTEPGEAVTFNGDPEAEAAVLAGCLNDPKGTPAARRSLTPAAFFRGDNAVIFTAIAELDDRGAPTDPYAVYDQLRQTETLTADLATRIHTLYAYPYAGPSMPWAIRRVANLARQRERSLLARRIGQIGTDVADPDQMATALIRECVQLEALIEYEADDEAVPGLTTWEDFIARPARPGDAVVPGLLDRQEVVMILAAPGVGKSWLSRQVALSIAAGLHPFHAGRRIPPMRTLLIDLENPESTVHRQVADPYNAVRLLGGDHIGDRGWFWPHTEGLNIRKRADAALLERVIADTRPDLVCIGSLYNVFHRGSSDWDTSAEETIAVLNRLRARYNCALWIEHHMPKAEGGGHRGSPFGSSLWERWPSYGRVIQRVGAQFYTLAVFRGDREAGREFPVGLQRGGKLPWSPIWNQEELDLIKENFA